MHKDVGAYVNNCVICAIGKTQQKQKKAPQRPHSPKFPWQMVSIDVLGPYPEAKLTRTKYILIVEDIFTKWVEAFPMRRIETKDVIRVLRSEIFSRFGWPESLVTDNGSVFISRNMQTFCEENKIQHWFSACYHQRANPVERRVQELKKVLGILLTNEKVVLWQETLPIALQVLRGRINRATGESPASLVLGYEISLPGEWNMKHLQRGRPTKKQRKRK